MTYFELALCQKIGNVFSLAVSKYKLNRTDFINEFLKSNVFFNICDGDCTLISQGKYYILNKFLDESPLPETNISDFDENAMFWLGYVMMYWCLTDTITGSYIVSNYDLEKIYQFYDILHSLKVSSSINDIKENFSLSSNSPLEKTHNAKKDIFL